MRVRFLREWRGAKVGGVRDLPGGVADLIVRRGIAVYDPTTVDVSGIENASVVPVETAVRRKRGRPRKVQV